MTIKKEIYKCELCGNIVEVLHVGGGTLVCCGAPMTNMNEKTSDEGQEKHVPVLEKTDTDISVSVGIIPHPMEETHYIEWIEIETTDKMQKKFLSSCNEPKAEFETTDDVLSVRTYCNIHGLWKKDMRS